MIRPTDLRIGNYVMNAVSGEWMIVDEIGETVGAILINRDKYPLPKGWRMEYIPLTPEIIERCIFEYGFHVTYNKESYKEHSKAVFWFQRIEGYGEPVTKQVVYLHKLQNIYYEHTDCELEIKNVV